MDELTRIYSCGKSMTTEQLIDQVIDTRGDVDIWFPETTCLDGWAIPLSEYEILRNMPRLVGKTIITVSEIPILFFLREIRKRQMMADELELWCGDRQIDIGINGDMIDYWDEGFFELGFHLRFT